MSRLLQSTGPAPVLSPAAAGFFKRRALELLGLALLAATALLFLAFATYSPADPSFNTATSRPARNFLGPLGAHMTDLLVQLFGLAGALPVLMLAGWALRCIRKKTVPLVWLRLLGMIPVMALAGAGLSPILAPAGWLASGRPGGAVGALLFEWTTVGLAALPFVDVLDASIVSIAFLVAAGAGFTLTLGLAISDVTACGNAVLAVGSAAGRGIQWGRESLADMRERIEPTFGRRRPETDEDEDVEVLEVPAPEPAAAPDLVAPRPAAARVGRKAKAERQGRLNLGPEDEFRRPPLDLLAAPPKDSRAKEIGEDALEQNARLLSTVLEDFGVRGQIVKVRPGPVVTLYELEPAPGTKTSRVIGLADDIARSMSAVSVRVAVVPGRNVIGIELPNVSRETVYLRELLSSETYERTGGKLPLTLGKDIGGQAITADLSRMPHLLIAGTTGSGKSVAINAMILSLVYHLSPEQCRFIMVDPKMLELSVYDGIPHLLTPVVTEPSKAVVALKWTVREMEDRYRAMSQLGVRNIQGYNLRLAEARRRGESLTRRVQTGFDDQGKPVYEEHPLALVPLPLIVVIVDEMADLMLVAGKDVEASVQRLAQMARAAGIHLIMATQRPSVDVITGTIKANFPTRVSFQVTSKIDSRTILGEQGAEQLLGHGDMLYMVGGGRIMRVHGPFVSDAEVESVVRYLKSQGEPAYIEEVTEDDPAGFGLGGDSGGDSADELYQQAVGLVAREHKASTSFIQRHLQIGYNRAARIIEQMEAEGVVSQANRVGRREVLIGQA
ncbi:MAG: DNA translocase FtsK [Rhodospirillales bacterium]|nr:DNA translocase FtsK [Rhodospirillales bacterium]